MRRYGAEWAAPEFVCVHWARLRAVFREKHVFETVFSTRAFETVEKLTSSTFASSITFEWEVWLSGISSVHFHCMKQNCAQRQNTGWTGEFIYCFEGSCAKKKHSKTCFSRKQSLVTPSGRKQTQRNPNGYISAHVKLGQNERQMWQVNPCS